ncbi:Uncharacterized protein family UPF0150 domain protein [mine drainage metagenome]|uniref:Uncharacterized protein family UPF0150 domain protein n=1 Tax=mine drainage metagenome TaxID=410659 RepID=T1D092_9ZZZZ
MPFTAVITRDEAGWYVAQCEELPGCFTQGKTIEQTEANFARLLPEYLEVLAERRNRPFAPPASEATVRRVKFVVAAAPA